MAAARGSSIDERGSEKVKVNDNDLLEQKTTNLDEVVGLRCPVGKKTGFLRTQGFELFENNDVSKTTDDVDECISFCEKNNVGFEEMNHLKTNSRLMASSWIVVPLTESGTNATLQKRQRSQSGKVS